jgi:hypothetical protein
MASTTEITVVARPEAVRANRELVYMPDIEFGRQDLLQLTAKQLVAILTGRASRWPR